MAALLLCVLGSCWIALGATEGSYLLELPTSARPHWIAGPLRGIGGLVGSLSPTAFSAALILMAGAYLLALLCARALPLRAVLPAIALANLAFTLGPTIVSSDVFGYIAYARELVLHGLNPYVAAPIAIRHDSILQFVYWKHQPSPYGPLFTALSAPLGLLSGSAALWTFKLATGLASFGACWLIARTAPARGLNPSRAAIFVGLNPVLLLYGISGAHNDVLAMLLVACALALMVRGNNAASGAFAVGALAIKLTLGLALPFIVLGAHRPRLAARGAAIALAAIGVPAVVIFGPHFFDQLQRISTDHLFDTRYSGPDRLATALGSQITSPIRTLCTALAGILALVMLLRVRRGADAITAGGWAFLGMIASIASLAPWYLVWLLPLAALGRSRPLRVATLLLTAYLIVIHLPALGGEPWLSQAGRATPAPLAQVLPRPAPLPLGAQLDGWLT
jgi:hypothetical protein